MTSILLSGKEDISFIHTDLVYNRDLIFTQRLGTRMLILGMKQDFFTISKK